jgi:hypothetical protein
MANKDFPVPPTTVFEHAFGEPRRMKVRIDAGSIHIPEQVV